MTIAPDIAEHATPDPSDYRPRRRLLTVWALLAFGALCALAGVLITVYGQRLLSSRRPSPPVTGLAASAPLTSTPSGALPPTPPSSPRQPEPVAPDVAALQGRISALETVQARTADAVIAALTASALGAAAEQSRPFEPEAASAERALPLSADVRALSRLATTGAPSRAALQAGFADPAAHAVVALRDPGQDAGLTARAIHALSSIVSIRRVDATTGAGFDATLARAEQQVSAGDIESALATLQRLPPGPQAAFAVWRVGAERRVEIDRRIASLRQSAMADLSRALRERP
jgi:hypothetical protein